MFDLEAIVTAAGYVGLFGIIFAESGLFIGFFLPGDSLLFTAGFLASQGFFHIGTLLLLFFLGAVLGDSFGYYFGKTLGPKVFTREDSIFFHREHLQRAERFYDTHGPITIVLARFLPVIRTFAPILAGVGKMRYRTFVTYNVLGGAIWGTGIPLLGYFLGATVPGIDRFLVPIVLLIITTSVLPSAIPLLRSPERRRKIWQYLTRSFRRSS